MVVLILVAALAIAPQSRPRDPHRGEFTTGLDTTCAACHDPKNPRAESRYDGAKSMLRMMTGLNNGPLKSSKITCFTCHRALHVVPGRITRSLVETRMLKWPRELALNDVDARKPARSVYKNLTVLGDVEAGEIRRVMSAYAASLGVECDYCHATDWSADTKPAKRTARSMIAMMKEFPKYFTFARATAFDCYTCHKGSVKIPRASS